VYIIGVKNEWGLKIAVGTTTEYCTVVGERVSSYAK
jgi:hypothetical protein